MSWICELAEDARKDLRDVPKAIQERVARVMMQMATDPFQGNVKALQGKEWRGVFRRRIGDYRLLFSASREQGTVTVLRILLRSGETYR
jgi:mRNA-degrading endonuclease RelE of RelBE toxin-antitoxin system